MKELSPAPKPSFSDPEASWQTTGGIQIPAAQKNIPQIIQWEYNGVRASQRLAFLCMEILTHDS